MKSGLLSQRQQPQQGPPPSDMVMNQQGPQQKPGQNGQQVDPQIQRQFDMMVINGMKMIHDQKVSDSFLGRIAASKNPIKTIAEQTVDIVIRLVDSAIESNVQISNDALVQAANVLMGELMNLAEKAGMQKLSEEQRRECFQLAVGMYIDRAVKSGKLTEEQVVALGKQVQNSPEGQKIAQQIEGGVSPSARQQPQQQGQGGQPPSGLLSQPIAQQGGV